MSRTNPKLPLVMRKIELCNAMSEQKTTIEELVNRGSHTWIEVSELLIQNAGLFDYLRELLDDIFNGDEEDIT